jgi:16S rRNA G1207 methylase RsmC
MPEHYFSPTSATPDVRRPLQVTLDGRERTLETADAVFSGDRLDKATAVLLDRLDHLSPVPPGARILDLGCGWGPIALTAAHRQPGAEVWAIDVSERARDLTARNAERLGVTVRVAAPEQLPSDLHFDVIWSNPPIRIGKDALHELLLTWCSRLQDNGTAALVVGKNLGADPLTAWLASRFPERPVKKAASAKGFRIIEVGARSR